jgi:hypothetical protein
MVWTPSAVCQLCWPCAHSFYPAPTHCHCCGCCCRHQVGQLKGFAYTSKDRWVVIAPRFTPPPPGGAVGEVRVMLLLFRNAAEGEPRTKLWLDGASISRSQGGEALLVSTGRGSGVVRHPLLQLQPFVVHGAGRPCVCVCVCVCNLLGDCALATRV